MHIPPQNEAQKKRRSHALRNPAHFRPPHSAGCCSFEHDVDIPAGSTAAVTGVAYAMDQDRCCETCAATAGCAASVWYGRESRQRVALLPFFLFFCRRSYLFCCRSVSVARLAGAQRPASLCWTLTLRSIQSRHSLPRRRPAPPQPRPPRLPRRPRRRRRRRSASLSRTSISTRRLCWLHTRPPTKPRILDLVLGLTPQRARRRLIGAHVHRVWIGACHSLPVVVRGGAGGGYGRPHLVLALPDQHPPRRARWPSHTAHRPATRCARPRGKEAARSLTIPNAVLLCWARPLVLDAAGSAGPPRVASPRSWTAVLSTRAWVWTIALRATSCHRTRASRGPLLYDSAARPFLLLAGLP